MRTSLLRVALLKAKELVKEYDENEEAEPTEGAAEPMTSTNDEEANDAPVAGSTEELQDHTVTSLESIDSKANCADEISGVPGSGTEDAGTSESTATNEHANDVLADGSTEETTSGKVTSAEYAYSQAICADETSGAPASGTEDARTSENTATNEQTNDAPADGLTEEVQDNKATFAGKPPSGPDGANEAENAEPRDTTASTRDKSTEKATDEKLAPPEGTLILDASCYPSNIRYPTDTGLVCEARVKLEGIIDKLHAEVGGKKPRTYRIKAAKEYMCYALKMHSTLRRKHASYFAGSWDMCVAIWVTLTHILNKAWC